jgi:hypothetical protein
LRDTWSAIAQLIFCLAVALLYNGRHKLWYWSWWDAAVVPFVLGATAMLVLANRFVRKIHSRLDLSEK